MPVSKPFFGIHFCIILILGYWGIPNTWPENKENMLLYYEALRPQVKLLQ